MGKENKFLNGYKECFIKKEVSIPLPKLSKEQLSDLAPVIDNEDGLLNYIHFSTQISASRKFPYYTASNIDGSLFKKADRAANWQKDDRVKNFQWGSSLYQATNSNFDKGHMTKREDVQWGNSEFEAQEAADSTFFYPNAVPQHKNLNQVVWANLEDYILHSETVKKSLKICVFTGPVLLKDDPEFITKIKDEKVQIPVHFWKIVYFIKESNIIHKAGFIMSQKELLSKEGTIINKNTTTIKAPFSSFKSAETYQVKVSVIEKITSIQFPKGEEVYTKDKSIPLIYKETDIKPKNKIELYPNYKTYKIQNLII
jgi:endonuclease G